MLDIGCGGGILSESMAREGAQVLAIDLARPVLDVAEAEKSLALFDEIADQLRNPGHALHTRLS